MAATATTPKLTREEAIKIANEILRLEATIKEMKEMLKEYVKENGELVAGDTKWLFQNSISWEFNDSEKTKEFLKSLVIDGYTTDPFSIITCSKSTLDKLGLEESYINKFATKKTSTRFVNRKK